MPELKQKEPALLFFYEIMPGDVLKFQTKSNTAQTGGGARDLRPRPGAGFGRVLRPMFPRETEKAGAFEGTIHWFDGEGSVLTQDIRLWTIYEARKGKGCGGEARIGTSYKVKAWTISEENYNKALQNGIKRFYVLLMDRDKATWAYIMNEEDLEHWNPQVRDYVRKRISLTRKGKKPPHVVGSLNFVTGEEYP